MENKKILLSALLFSGTLTLGLPMCWSQGVKGESQQAAAGDVKQAQQALKDKGHDPGPIDGILGPKTQAALKAFQQANNIKATARLDAETKGKLGVSGGGQADKQSGKRESRESTSGPGK